jgi:hypothetical protein
LIASIDQNDELIDAVKTNALRHVATAHNRRKLTAIFGRTLSTIAAHYARPNEPEHYNDGA